MPSRGVTMKTLERQALREREIQGLRHYQILYYKLCVFEDTQNCFEAHRLATPEREYNRVKVLGLPMTHKQKEKCPTHLFKLRGWLQSAKGPKRGKHSSKNQMPGEVNSRVIFVHKLMKIFGMHQKPEVYFPPPNTHNFHLL